jgi:hypothetical protein
MPKLVTKEMRREKRRGKRDYYYVVDPDKKEIQMTFGKPKPEPKAVIYLPHYENSLRIEIPLPKGDPDEVQNKLDEYKDKFIDWFGGNKQRGYNWGNKTRRWAYGKISLKVQNIKLPRSETRALRTLFMYKGILHEFKKGKERKAIVDDIAKHKKFEFEQVRKVGKYSRKTGIIMRTHRKASTINRDISSLVKVGLLRRVGRGKYEVVPDKEMELEGIERVIIRKKER